MRRRTTVGKWLQDVAPTRTPRRPGRIKHMRPPVVRAVRLLRATSRLGVPGALPAPPELLPSGAKVLAQGYLNRFSMPLVTDWLLPPWMRRQADPTSPSFVPRSVANLMINQTARNWTALGVPGAQHPIESIVDPYGLLTPVPGGPSIDWWAQLEGDGDHWMAAAEQAEVVQRLQGDLPVVLTAFEANGLRMSSEAWMLALPGGDWAAMQVVLFNIADMPLRGTFRFALRPYNPEGISPVSTILYDGQGLRADGRRGMLTWPRPEGWALSGVRQGDLFRAPAGKTSPSSLYDPHGFAHGVLEYSFNIEPWEEAEFLAFMPVHTPRPREKARGSTLFSMPPLELKSPDPGFYSKAKAGTTLEWRRVLDGGMKISVPDRDLQASWEANRAHLLALHDGDDITPGPDLYHSFWFRDAAYMVNALSLCGYASEVKPLLRGFVRRQRRDGAFISHHGEWDSTGQALWAIARHLRLHPDPELEVYLRRAVRRGAHWISGTLSSTADGLMPPGVSAEHLGPPDRYYWDNLWSLAGLEASTHLLAGDRTVSRAAATLRSRLAELWETDMQANNVSAVPAAPGRRIDFGMVGSLVAWFPLGLLTPDSPLLDGGIDTLRGFSFYEGGLFVGTGHSGWGTYLNMRLAGCRLMQGSQEGWEAMRWILKKASPTYNWPEAIYPHSGGGSAGDGQHGWASAEWLMLVRALLLDDAQDRLTITPVLPEQWLQQPGQIEVERAPTIFGPLSYSIEWQEGGRDIQLSMSGEWRTPPRKITWRVPGPTGGEKSVPIQASTIRFSDA